MTAPHEDKSVFGDELYIGVDAGSVSVNSIVIDAQKRVIHESPYQRHFGKVEETVAALFDELYAQFGRERIAGVAFTGSHGKLLSEQSGAPYEFETISQVLGRPHVRPDVRTVISMGGQETALFQITHPTGASGEGGWELEYFQHQWSLRLGHRLFHRPAGPETGHQHVCGEDGSTARTDRPDPHGLYPPSASRARPLPTWRAAAPFSPSRT